MNKLILLPVAIFVAASALSSCSSCQNEEKEGQKVKETITSGVIDISLSLIHISEPTRP